MKNYFECKEETELNLKEDKMQEHYNNLIMFLIESKIIELVAWAVVVDTIFGLARAVRERKLNSCFGIDGAIRKISMIVSIICLAVVDMVLMINLIGFVPEKIRAYLPDGMNTIGIAEFFGLLYIAYEIVSILKNMALCGLPVKRIWNVIYRFLNQYTDELPDSDEMDGNSNIGSVDGYRKQGNKNT